MAWYDPAHWTIYIVMFFGFHLVGLGHHVLISKVAGRKPFMPLSLGRDLYGAGLFFFFFAILFIIAYGSHMASVIEEDSSGNLALSEVKDDFTFAMFVALKDVGATIGIVLGFLSLAWARFFERSIGEGTVEQPAVQKIEVICRCSSASKDEATSR